MTQHPSLNAPFVRPEPIRAVANLDPYVPCWCRSGKKYKFCHFRRERKDPINIYDVEKEMLQQFSQGYCSYPRLDGDECSPGISKAHTIQRKGGLAAIAEAGHVLSVKPSMQMMIEHEGVPHPRRVGVRQASVFPGFCSKHDAATFLPIEGKNVDFDKPSALLFAYRSIAYARFAKQAELKSIEIWRKMDRGQPLRKQEFIQDYLHVYEEGIKIGMRDVDVWKCNYDTRILSGDLDRFYFHAVRFDLTLPIVGCGAFHPEFDLRGNALQQLARPDFEFEHLALSVTAYAEQTVAFFGWIGEPSGPAGTFVESFEELSQDRKADALVRIAFEQMDNIYLQQSWWEALPKSDQSRLLLHIPSGTSGAPRTFDCLVDHGTAYANANVIETASS